MIKEILRLLESTKGDEQTITFTLRKYSEMPDGKGKLEITIKTKTESNKVISAGHSFSIYGLFVDVANIADRTTINMVLAINNGYDQVTQAEEEKSK